MQKLSSQVQTEEQHHKLALVVIAAAQLMVLLDLTIVNIALPSMKHDLHFSSTNLVWVIDAYALAFGGLLLLGGKSGDLFGRKKMFTIGILLFTLSSFAGGLSVDQLWLIIARTFQGIGAAIASPTALSLITVIFKEGSERNRAMTVYAAMSATGGALGLLLGGVLVDLFSWRWVLFVNVPIGLLILVLTPYVIPNYSGIRVKIDYLGALSISTGMVFLVYGLLKVSETSWGNNLAITAFVVALILMITFITIELKTTEPLMPLKFLINRNRAGGYLIMLFLGGAMLSLIYFLTQFMQEILKDSPIVAGVAYLPIPFMVGITGVVVSKVVRKVGYRPFLIVGPLMVALGFLWLSRISASSDYLDIFGPLVLIGIGMGLSFVPLTLNAVSSVDHAQTGLASALLNSSQQIGGSLGLAVLVSAYVSTFKNSLASNINLTKSFTLAKVSQSSELVQHAMVSGYKSAFLIGSGFAGLAFLIGVLSIRQTKSTMVGIDDIR